VRSRTLLVLAIVVLGAGGYAVFRMTRPPLDDKTQIQNLILTASRALEQQRVKSFMAVVADDYNDGTYNKQDVENLVRGAVLQSGEIRVVPYLRSLQIQATTATATVEAEVTVGYTRGNPHAEPGRGRYTVEMALRKGRHGWQVTSARGWESAQAQFGGEM